MHEHVVITLTVEELRSIIREEVTAALLDSPSANLELPALLTRQEFMDLMRISSTTATSIMNRSDFKVFREGKVLIERDFLFEWIRKNSY